jgi:hypothetical protein
MHRLVRITQVVAVAVPVALVVPVRQTIWAQLVVLEELEKSPILQAQMSPMQVAEPVGFSSRERVAAAVLVVAVLVARVQ